MSKALLFYNPVAGRVMLSTYRLHYLIEQLFSLGIQTEAVCSKPRTEPSPALNLAGKDLIIVYGGDGTINNVLSAVVQHDIPLALLPAGTANVLATELGIPRDPDRALRIIGGGTEARISLGCARGGYFHLMAGVGVDGFVLNRVSGRAKRLLGVGSYWMAGLASYPHLPLQPFEIQADEATYRGTFAVISNCRGYGGQLLITPQASLYENVLDVCIFTSTSRNRFFKYLYGALDGSHIHYPDVVYLKSSRVEVRGCPSTRVQLDGDLAGHLPITLGTCSAGLRILVPDRAVVPSGDHPAPRHQTMGSGSQAAATDTPTVL